MSALILFPMTTAAIPPVPLGGGGSIALGAPPDQPQLVMPQTLALTGTIGVGPPVSLGEATADGQVSGLVPVLAGFAPSARQSAVSTWYAQALAGINLYNSTGSRVNTIHTTEGQNVTLWARLVDAEQRVLLRADISTILVNVFDTTSVTRVAPVHQETLEVNSAMSSALQLDAGWRRDRHGYSFKYVLPGSVFAEGGRVYRVEVIFNTHTQGPITVIYPVHTEGIYTPRSELG